MDLALFDFDGTVTDRETMPDFMRMAVRPRRLMLGKILLFPLIVGYKAGVVSGVVVRAAICRFGFRSVPASEIEALGRRFAGEFLPTTLRKEAMDRIAWHQARGDTVVVVSGGLGVYLRPWCQANGLRLLCSELEQHDGKLTGRYLGKQCVRAEKARRIVQDFPPTGFGNVFAYGDTPEDREMLALAHVATYRWQPMAGPP